MSAPSLSLHRFDALKQRVQKLERIAGTYILEATEVPSDARLDPARHAFMLAFAASHGFSPPDVGEAEWTNAEVFRDEAREQLIDNLVGGTAIGHSQWDVPPDVASALADDFFALFVADARFFCSVNPHGRAQMLAPYARPDFSDFIFGGGCIAIDSRTAAIFWVLDND